MMRAGLSPPTRGSLSRVSCCSAFMRSIPAHAGEPVVEAIQLQMGKVYPRPRGGAAVADVNAPSE